MSRLLDDLRRRDANIAMPRFIAPHLKDRWLNYSSTVFSLLNDELTVLDVNDVAEYYFSVTDQEYWDLTKHFPDLRPPHKRWWSEHRIPRVIHSRIFGDTDVSQLVANGRVGVLFTALDPDEVKGEGIPPNVRWILWSEIFIDYGRRDFTAEGPHSPIFLALDAQGNIVDRPWVQGYSEPGKADQQMKDLMTWLYPSLLAVSFLNRKCEVKV